MFAAIVLLIVVATLNATLGLIVFVRNIRNITYTIFFGLALSVAVWNLGIAMFIASDNPATALLWSKVYYAAALQIALLFFLFALVYVKKQRGVTYRNLIYLVPGLALFLVLYSNYGFLQSGIRTIEGSTREVILNDFGYSVFGAIFLGYFYGAHLVLYRRYLRAKGSLKAHLQYLLLGPLFAGFFGVVFNLLLPWLGNYRLIWVGPIFSAIFVGAIFYAVIRHRLFDIRLVVARSIAYTLLLATVGVLYGTAIFGISSVLFPGQLIGGQQQFVYIALAILVAFTFQPLRRFFERITDKIFFRDKYDSQQVISDLGAIFASQIDINVIIESSLSIIAKAIKPIHAAIVVVDEHKIYKQAMTQDVRSTLSMKELKVFHKNTYVTDELSGGAVKRVLQKHNLAVVTRLITQEGVVGFVLLGQKQSGAIYGTQDIKLLETIGPALAVAVQNARSYEKIADFNITLQERIKEATRRLRVQNQRLRELDEAKDEFISMASHQLRTPLTAIKGYVSMLAEGDGGKLNDQQAEYTDLAYTSAQRMVYLIADMLNVSRINTGKLVIDKNVFDFEQVVKDEIRQLNRTAQARGVKLKFTPPKAKLPRVQLDEGKMRQVIMNFMDNAVFYAPNSTVDIKLEQAGGKLRFSVTDHGIGVPAKEKENLFKKFYRAPNAKKARPDGTGLGLYMAKMVTELQGGQIIFNSQEGKGSTFGFEFDLAKIAAQAGAKKTKNKGQVVLAK